MSCAGSPLLAVATVAVFGVVMLTSHAAAAQPAAKTFAYTVNAKGIAEKCFRLPADASIGYAFHATGPVDFNIHFHRGSDVEYPVRSDQVRQADARFVAPSTQEYCLMWTNRTAAPLFVSGTLAP